MAAGENTGQIMRCGKRESEIRRTGATGIRLPAEWERQDGVLLCWPHRDTPWAPWLSDVEAVFISMIRAIARDERVLLIARCDTGAAAKLQAVGIDLNRLRLFSLNSDDTWARDFGPIAVEAGRELFLRDFVFNGWGRKHPFRLDNLINRGLHVAGAFGTVPLSGVRYVLEGGSIETDGAGSILATSACLLAKNRNPGFTRRQVEEVLHRTLGARRLLWLNNGALEGDDTDSHIDTLARFVNPTTIVYTACSDRRDSHYRPLSAMADELSAFRTLAGKPYRLIPLPLPRPCFNEQGDRLPATYANFLIINRSVLAPVYGCPTDRTACRILAGLFPRRRVVPIDCSVIIRKRGAVHCLTMQLPRGILACKR